MRRRCSLCGGKLSGNVCTECGLDNSKSDASYVTGKSHGDEVSLTHVHKEDEDPFAGKTMTREQQEQLKEKIQLRRQPGNRKAADKKARENVYGASSTYKPNSKNRKKGIGVVIGLVIALAGVVPTLSECASEVFRDNPMGWGTEEEGWVDASEVSAEEDPYMFAQRELSEEGEEYEVILEAGSYKGGVHLPEGNYSVEYLEGKGYLSLDDWDNSIYLYGPLGYESVDKYEYLDDFRIYKDAVVKMDGTLRLCFRSENAQMDLNYMENPNTQTGEFSENFVAGKDIPAGVYDVTILEGKGSIGYNVLLNEATEYYSYEGADFMEDGAKGYKNVVLPEGVEVEIYGTIKIRLTPSEIIESVDYENFYPVF